MMGSGDFIKERRMSVTSGINKRSTLRSVSGKSVIFQRAAPISAAVVLKFPVFSAPEPGHRSFQNPPSDRFPSFYSSPNPSDMAYNHPSDPSPGYRQASVGGGLLRMLLGNPRILMALGLVVFAYIKYSASTVKQENAFTGDTVTVTKMTPEEETALGLKSVPEMAQQFGGEVRDPLLVNKINQIGYRLLEAKERIVSKRGKQDDEFDYDFQFHVLADEKTINAFALPGGQVFITMALLSRLPDEDSVAGVLGHEIGHVLARHSMQQMAKSGLLSGLVNAAVVATSDGRSNSGHIAQMVGQVVQTKHGREAESQSDRIGIQLMLEAGYKPEALLSVMAVLAESMKGGGRPPEILSSHPFPETRAKQIDVYIDFFRKNGTDAHWKN
jgi:Peptidase family M48